MTSRVAALRGGPSHPLAGRGRDSSSLSLSSSGTAPRSYFHSSLARLATRQAALTVRQASSAQELQPGLGAPHTRGSSTGPLGIRGARRPSPRRRQSSFLDTAIPRRPRSVPCAAKAQELQPLRKGAGLSPHCIVEYIV